MTLIFSDGFQDPVTMRKPEWDVLQVFSAQTGRDGTATSAASIPNNGDFKTATLPVPATVAIVSFAWQYTNSGAITGASTPLMMGLMRGGTMELCITINISGFIELRRGGVTGTLLGTSSGHAPIGINTWRHYALKASLSSTSAYAEVRIDDVPMITFTGQTAVTTGDVTGLRIQTSSVSGNSTHHWDDLVVFDDTDGTATDGRPNDDFPGDVKIATILPSAAGDSTQMTPSTGANYAAVDENPVNTTDYVSTSTPGHRDLYQHTDLPAASVQVLGIRQGIYAVKTDAGVASIKHVIKENSTVTVGSSKPLSTTYSGYWGSLIKIKPSDGTVFSVADANALQAGQELA